MGLKREGVFLVDDMNVRSLDSEGVQIIHQMRREGKLDEIEALLAVAVTTPAVADEYRKNFSLRARQAKKTGNWAAVAGYLETYELYAKKITPICIKVVNQAPRPLTDKDKALLIEARQNLGSERPLCFSVPPCNEWDWRPEKPVSLDDLRTAIAKTLNED